MALDQDKYIQPDGLPSAGKQPTKSATVGSPDLAAVALSGNKADVDLSNADNTSDISKSLFIIT